LKKLAITLILMLVAMSSTSMKLAKADHNNHPDFIDWQMVERWTYTYEYQMYENSPMVEWLQYWLGLKPYDGIYGPITYNKHESALRSSGMNPDEFLPVWQSPRRTFRDSVEVWRPIVTEALSYYDKVHEVDRFLSVMQCESGGLEDATNPSSQAAGLMQHLPQFWDDRARVAVGGRYAGESPYNGEANIWVSAWLLYAATGGGWQHWNFGCL
jgi:hypothetical protein